MLAHIMNDAVKRDGDSRVLIPYTDEAAYSDKKVTILLAGVRIRWFVRIG